MEYGVWYLKIMKRKVKKRKVRKNEINNLIIGGKYERN